MITLKSSGSRGEMSTSTHTTQVIRQVQLKPVTERDAIKALSSSGQTFIKHKTSETSYKKDYNSYYTSIQLNEL